MKPAITLLSFIVALFSHADYLPLVHGAKANLELTICDDDGSTISNANVRVSFLVKPTKEFVCDGTTDDRGKFSAECDSCIGRYTVRVSKEGFYDTFIKKSIRAKDMATVTKTKNWSVNAIENKIVLKPIKNPIKLQSSIFLNAAFPATNEVIKLDLQTLKWCPPHGNGKTDDIHLTYKEENDPDSWLNFTRSLEINFPHCADGFYTAKTDKSGSAMQYSYAANPEKEYKKKISFSFSRTAQTITQNTKLPDDEYLVFRVRTQTNETGKVISANYGIIEERIRYITGFSFGAKFNSRENDANLEDERVLRLQKNEQSRQKRRRIR